MSERLSELVRQLLPVQFLAPTSTAVDLALQPVPLREWLERKPELAIVGKRYPYLSSECVVARYLDERLPSLCRWIVGSSAVELAVARYPIKSLTVREFISLHDKYSPGEMRREEALELLQLAGVVHLQA